MQRILSDCQLNHKPAYCLNLDPAVGTLPYQANIDIRDTVNYKQVRITIWRTHGCAARR